MRQFDFYEFAGVIVPGAVFLTGLALAWPDGSQIDRLGDLSVGGLGLGVVLAYGAGHLIQAFGNMIEKAWWKAWKGMPSDWPRTNAHTLISPKQVSLLECQVGHLLDQPDFKLSEDVSPRDWYGIARQIYAVVASKGRATRVDVFNGNYGLCRGLAASFLALLPSIALLGWPGWRIALLLAFAFAIAIYRMHRFGVHYGREVFVQFLAVEGGAE